MPRYRDQFGREWSVPRDLPEAKAHRVAKAMAVAGLTPPERARYENGELKVFVVDELGRKHWSMFASTGRVGLVPGRG